MGWLHSSVLGTFICPVLPHNACCSFFPSQEHWGNLASGCSTSLPQSLPHCYGGPPVLREHSTHDVPTKLQPFVAPLTQLDWQFPEDRSSAIALPMACAHQARVDERESEHKCECTQRFFLPRNVFCINTELLAEKWHASNLPNNWIPTWVTIQAVHKYPILLVPETWKECARGCPSRLGGAQQLALINRRWVKQHVIFLDRLAFSCLSIQRNICWGESPICLDPWVTDIRSSHPYYVHFVHVA